MVFSKSVVELIAERFSCRSYRPEPIDEGVRRQLTAGMDSHSTGPFGSPTRFELIAADEANRKALRGLGTYGFIKSPTGFIVGAMKQGDKNLEDFGYAMESIILFATDLGLGTCWLGGSFTKSRFARAVEATNRESIPAVTSIGYIEDGNGGIAGEIRQSIGARNKRRHPWESLFFRESFDTPLERDEADRYATPLEMVRLGPSASNKQPWRIVRRGRAWHFYIQRTPGYREGWIKRLLRFADMQRLDAGIAMCHFELTAREKGLAGTWAVEAPAIDRPDALTEYVATWRDETPAS